MAVGSQTFSSLGAGVSDIFAGLGDFTKASGDIAEAQAYDVAAQLAGQEAQFTKESTDIQEAQQQREVLLSTGRTAGEVAGAGFSLSGSAIDILRESASQGSLQKAVIGQQGLITEAGYQAQQQSYEIMANAARDAASADRTAGIGSFIGAGIQTLAAVATL